MKNKTFLILGLGLAFAGFTSCGDDQDYKRDIQLEAMRRAYSGGGGGSGTSSVTVTVTQSNTVTATSTVTSTATSSVRE